MRIVLQRVSRASVRVDGVVTGAIGRGLLLLLGIGKGDTESDADYLIEKVLQIRIFPDSQDRMNLSLLDAGGGLLIVSQFTLFGDVRRGRRPSFDAAAPPADARCLYDYFVEAAKKRNVPVQTGVFQAMMEVELVNDGPVTILVESIRPAMKEPGFSSEDLRV